MSEAMVAGAAQAAGWVRLSALRPFGAAGILAAGFALALTAGPARAGSESGAELPPGLAGFAQAAGLATTASALAFDAAPGVAVTESGAVDWSRRHDVQEAARAVRLREGAARGYVATSFDILPLTVGPARPGAFGAAFDR